LLTNDVTSILGVAIFPPHPTILSLRMAVALYVTGISTPEVHPEFPPLLGTLTPDSWQAYNPTMAQCRGKQDRRALAALLVGCSLFAQACTGGGDQPNSETTDSAILSGPPFAADGPLAGIVMAKDINESGLPVEPGLEYLSSEPQVTAIVPLGEGADGRTLTIAWYRAVGLDERERLFEHEIQARSFANAYSVSVSQGSLQPGLYEVVATLDEHEVWSPWIVSEAMMIDLTSSGNGSGTILTQIDTDGQPPAGGGNGVIAWPDMASFPDGPELPDFETWGTEGEPGACPRSVFGVPMGMFIEAHASGAFCDDEIVLAAAATGPLQVIASGLGGAQEWFHPCDLAGGSDLPGSVIKLGGWTVDHEDEVLTASLELFDLGLNPIGYIRGTPGPRARVRPKQRVQLLGIGAHFPMPTAPSIKSLTLRGPDASVIATKEFEGEACDLARFFRGLKGSYRVPEDPPAIIEITLEVEDDAGRKSSTTAQYFTEGEIWNGVMKSVAVDEHIPGCTSTENVRTELNLAVSASGKVVGNATTFSITGDSSLRGECGVVPYPGTFARLDVEGTKTDQGFEIWFKAPTRGTLGIGFQQAFFQDNLSRSVSQHIPLTSPTRAAGTDTATYAGGAYHSTNTFKLRCKICD
jgi:hypothetical protein